MWIVYLGAIIVPLLFLAWNLVRGTPSPDAAVRPSRREQRRARKAARERRDAAPRRSAALRMAPPALPPHAATVDAERSRRPSLGRRLLAVPGAFAAGFRVAWSELVHGSGSSGPARSRRSSPAPLRAVPDVGAPELSALPAPHVPRTPSAPGWVPAPGYAAAPTQALEADPEESLRTCPDCAESVPRRAAVCSHCGHRFVYGAAAGIA